ncbi:host specificity protein, partial [Cribrihabitans sp. XS_ASV171]
WDEGPDLQVRLTAGALEARTAEAVLNGANLAAIGDGSSGNWELFQFREAELIGNRTYLLRGRLRGQAGTDALMPEAWPAGSVFVLIDERLTQIDLPSSQRRMARHFRIGPSKRGYDDPSYRHLVEAFEGHGLRPFAPVHLQAQKAGGEIRLDWIRRTRIDGDDWSLPEVPLGEESERYLLRVVQEGAVLREEEVSIPQWVYSAAMQAEDGVFGLVELRVAQVSARYGAGPFASTQVGL